MAGCVTYQKSKADRHGRQTKMFSITTGERTVEEIARDLNRKLRESLSFDAIPVNTDQFTAVEYYLPAKTTCTVQDVANSYINDIWKLYSLRRHIGSDQGLEFACKFLKELNNKVNINQHVSTANHLGRDRLSNRVV